MTLCVVLASGGVDSTTAIVLRRSLGDEVLAVSVDYGQRHRREIEAAAEVARHYEIEHIVVDLAGLAAVLSGSALTDPTVEVPDGHYTAPVMAATVVPNRNAILANVAVGVAVARKAAAVVLGVHAGDHPIYPDCRPEFVDALNTCVQVATAGYHTPTIEAPFLYWDKAQIVKQGARLGAPLHLTWSCYRGGALHCGRCGTCVERAAAFAEVGVPDPTEYVYPDAWRVQVGAP